MLSRASVEPTCQVASPRLNVGRSPRGRLVECGGIWKKQNRDTGADYFTLSIRDFAFNANLGKAANQDDDRMQAVIPWGPKEAA